MLGCDGVAVRWRGAIRLRRDLDTLADCCKVTVVLALSCKLRDGVNRSVVVSLC